MAFLWLAHMTGWTWAPLPKRWKQPLPALHLVFAPPLGVRCHCWGCGAKYAGGCLIAAGVEVSVEISLLRRCRRELGPPFFPPRPVYSRFGLFIRIFLFVSRPEFRTTVFKLTGALTEYCGVNVRWSSVDRPCGPKSDIGFFAWRLVAKMRRCFLLRVCVINCICK